MNALSFRAHLEEWLVDDHAIFHPLHRVPAYFARNKYAEYCIFHYRYPATNVAFNAGMRDLGYAVKPVRVGKKVVQMWLGFTFPDY